jgi:hypothetical protein
MRPKVFLVLLVIGILTLLALAASQTTLTGVISDDMCGKSHTMGEGTPADCTRACVKAGSHYAIVVGDKVYKVQDPDKNVAADLDKYAGEKVRVTGEVSGDSIHVKSVGAAK